MSNSERALGVRRSVVAVFMLQAHKPRCLGPGQFGQAQWVLAQASIHIRLSVDAMLESGYIKQRPVSVAVCLGCMARRNRPRTAVPMERVDV